MWIRTHPDHWQASASPWHRQATGGLRSFSTETEAFEKVRGALEQQAGLVEDMTLFHEVHPNPVEADVCGAAEAFRRGTCNGIIGLGGGSALDVAKVCRLLVKTLVLL